jgi:hypothetical protein
MSAVTEPRPAYFPSATSIPSPRSPFEHPAARRPVHEPSTTSANPGPDPEVEAAALRLRQDLEWRIFDRAREMNVRHADAAWERRYQRPLGPYGLAFLFRPARPPQGPQTVAAATKLWLAGPDPADPVDLLGALADLARSRPAGEAWDVREEICDRAVGVTDDAVYLGLAMSSLDTRTGTFAQACATAGSALQIPGTIAYVAGTPGSAGGQRALVADRRAANAHNKVTVWSHRALSTPVLLSPYPYVQVGLDKLYRDTGLGDVLQAMTALDAEVRTADTCRRAMTADRGRRRGRP